jgi:plasmid stability protein
MDLVIHDVPAQLLEKLDKKAKASGRTVEAEATAILSGSLKEDEEEADPAEAFLNTVDAMYGKDRPKNVVDEFLAERRKLWGEEDR